MADQEILRLDEGAQEGPLDAQEGAQKGPYVVDIHRKNPISILSKTLLDERTRYPYHNFGKVDFTKKQSLSRFAIGKKDSKKLDIPYVEPLKRDGLRGDGLRGGIKKFMKGLDKSKRMNLPIDIQNTPYYDDVVKIIEGIDIETKNNTELKKTDLLLDTKSYVAKREARLEILSQNIFEKSIVMMDDLKKKNIPHTKAKEIVAKAMKAEYEKEMMIINSEYPIE